jgi:hypothetical protein
MITRIHSGTCPSRTRILPYAICMEDIWISAHRIIFTIAITGIILYTTFRKNGWCPYIRTHTLLEQKKGKCAYYCYQFFLSYFWLIDWFLVFNVTFSNISAISWRTVVVVEKARENKPITNKAWVPARLCKLQKRCTRIATASDKVYQFLLICLVITV